MLTNKLLTTLNFLIGLYALIFMLGTFYKVSKLADYDCENITTRRIDVVLPIRPTACWLHQPIDVLDDFGTIFQGTTK